MENFEKDCWYKKVYTDPDMDFYDVFKFDFTTCNSILHHTCFYRLSFDGNIKYYKTGITLNNNTITKLNGNSVGILISDHKEIIKDLAIEKVVGKIVPNNWVKITSNYIYKKSIDVKEEIEYLQNMIKYFNEKIELLKKN